MTCREEAFVRNPRTQPSVGPRARARLAQIYSPILDDRGWRNVAARILSLNLALVALSFVASELYARGIVGYYVAWGFIASNDHSVPEFVGYMEMAATCWLMFQVFKVTRSQFDLLLMGISGFLMLDDLLRLHDRLRVTIGAHMFSGTRFFTAVDLGQAVYSATIIAILTLLLISVARRVESDDVIRGLPLLAAMVLLGFFAIGIDNVHQVTVLAAPNQPFLRRLVATIEDGGELVAMGLMAIAASAQHRLFSASASAVRQTA